MPSLNCRSWEGGLWLLFYKTPSLLNNNGGDFVDLLERTEEFSDQPLLSPKFQTGFSSMPAPTRGTYSNRFRSQRLRWDGMPFDWASPSPKTLMDDHAHIEKVNEILRLIVSFQSLSATRSGALESFEQ